MPDKSLYMKSSLFGAGLGIFFGAILGAVTGALSASWSGVQFGALWGIAFGMLTGALTGALTVRTAGTTGGVSTGAYTGMLFGALLGVLGIFIPEAFRASVLALDILILNVIMQGRFEMVALLMFLLSIIGTAVGAWVGGRILKSRNLDDYCK
ncbi:MAG: hypothetical protein Q8L87_12070 [Anaerolineales bacterium]|nr:hypothetical protein [Anaerolineales bacterium]